MRIRILITLFIVYFAVIEATPAALKVGLIYDVTGRGDLSFCDAAYAGAKKAEEEWGFKLTGGHAKPQHRQRINAPQARETEI